MRNSIFIFLVLLLMGIGNSYGQKKKNKATPPEIEENDTIPYHWVEEKPRFKECEDIPEVQHNWSALKSS